MQTKIYRATARISAVPARPDWGLGNSAKDLLRNFVNNISTHDMANRVIAQAQLDMNSYDLLAKITVSAEPENFIIRIDAKDRDPEIAKRIVKKMADLFVDERLAYYNTQDKANRIEVKLVDSVIDAPLYQPKPLMNAIAGFVLGAIIGALIVLALEWMSADVLATPENVEKATGLPVLGIIPRRRQQRARSEPMTANLVTLTDPASPTAEAYRRLRVNLASAGRDAPLQTVLVVAAGPDDDKAKVVANLAVAFAKVGKQVIVADCDLHHPAQHTLFGLENAAGVTTALATAGGSLPLQGTEVAGLRVLTSGPAVAVPADALASPAMADLVARLRSQADVVLIDAPPVTQTTDAVELATQVDGVLLTVHAGQTKRDQAQRAKEALEKVGARVVGVALVDAAT